MKKVGGKSCLNISPLTARRAVMREASCFVEGEGTESQYQAYCNKNSDTGRVLWLLPSGPHLQVEHMDTPYSGNFHHSFDNY